MPHLSELIDDANQSVTKILTAQLTAEQSIAVSDEFTQEEKLLILKHLEPVKQAISKAQNSFSSTATIAHLSTLIQDAHMAVTAILTTQGRAMMYLLGSDAMTLDKKKLLMSLMTPVSDAVNHAQSKFSISDN